ncbi:hypothetical protein C900_03719 [Fulvivirga imtechensis AK7]|uniref:DUF1573 domain-containing protein n=1 Tax=Fulvivirga imtechensis AK7 TaxID=1237149 RepID=L8JNP7_9BACT|nr:DUF1573 domain-containing protein [Fulvivirga imtechensis]ELR70465.1 hypothetical protein C900_03719 [Fulvivirga imtechensis AK7]
MTVKHFLLVIVGMVSTVFVYAQQAEELVFSEKTFDFGTVKEEDGPIIHEFSFINKGLKPIKITGVKASCGCTTPDWTKETVNPGETGYIQAQYNPRNRPGAFNKSLTVTTDASNTPMRLYIKGNVVPKPKSVEEELPTAMGGLRVKYRSFNMGKVETTDEPAVKEFQVYNMSETPVTFLEKQEAPSYIRLEFDPQVLAPASEGVVKVIYDAKAKNDLGFSSDNVKFLTDEEGDDAVKSISVYATIEEYFPPMSREEMDKAPRLKLDENVHDFGKLNADKSTTGKFTLTNVGGGPLKIRQTKSNCTCVVAKLGKETLEPGESTEMEVTFNSEGRRGNQQKSVTIFSNDPRGSAQRVTIKGYVNSD